MTVCSLNGCWDLTDASIPETRYAAPVPGCIHDALLAAHVIPDINFRLNEQEAQWVGEQDWIYERTFSATPELLAADRVELVCNGLDTFASLQINHHPIGASDNMFRTWRFDIKPFLEQGDNSIRIRFQSVLPHMAEMTRQRHLPAWNEDTYAWDPDARAAWGYTGRGYVRKQACQFGWDWGPMTPSAGIWRDIQIEAWSTARIADWRTEQTHAPDGSVTLNLSLTPNTGGAVQAQATLSQGAHEPAITVDSGVFYGQKNMVLKIANPQLWWPNGLGAQPLYSLVVRLLTPDGSLLDTVKTRIGLRTLRLVREPDEIGTSFVFEVNGVRFFAKGANVIPLDAYPSSANLESRLRQLLGDAKSVHMNMLRVWGGGYFQHDLFYDICDELGICVWQDMLFGCGTYPTWDEAFMDNVFHEVSDNAKRLRHHACLACWCGNNELEQGVCAEDWTNREMSWSSYFDLFERLIPSALQRSDPTTAYVPGSPHSAPCERKRQDSETSGDVHFWKVWFTDAPFEAYRTTTPRFISEFGTQSFPDTRTIEAVTEPHDRRFDSDVLNKRQRSGPGNARILQQTRDWFGDGKDFNATCVLSQIAHGIALKTGIEHWRRQWPVTAGATYWQLNDCWPAQTWATIDSFGRWKAPHYFARRFFAPVLVSGLEDAETRHVSVYLHNDTRHVLHGVVSAEIHSPERAAPLTTRKWEIAAPPLAVVLAGQVDLASGVDGLDPGNLLTFLKFEPDDASAANRPHATNLVLMKRPRQIPLQPPSIHTEITHAAHDRHTLTLRTDKPALWVMLQTDGIDCLFSDNFFHLTPGTTHTVEVTPSSRIATKTLCDQLHVFDITSHRQENPPPTSLGSANL